MFNRSTTSRMRITLPLAVLLASAFPACTTGPSQPQPRLVEEGFGGEFNIIEFGGRYYALGQDEGEFDITKVERKVYRRVVVGNSIEDLKDKLNTALRSDENMRQTSQPALVEEAYKGEFNIIKYGNKYYALPQNEGAFDIKKIEEQEYKRFFVGNSLGEVKALIP